LHRTFGLEIRVGGLNITTAVNRVLVVDDSSRWRVFLRSILGQQPDLPIVGEASDGLEAVRKAQELQPHLIVLDISLPTLNGIEAARQIRHLSPKSRILFVSNYRDWEIAEEALLTGGLGYVVKSNAASELVPAIKAVLESKQFVSEKLAGHGLNSINQATGAPPHCGEVVTFTSAEILGIGGHHEAGFYSDERQFLHDVTRFLGTALRAGDAVIVIATESHRVSLLLELQDSDLEMEIAIDQGRYVALDAAEALSTFMVNGMPDPVRALALLEERVIKAGKAENGRHRRVSIFGECGPLLWAQGNAEAAIQMEKLGNKLIKLHDVDILCGYSVGTVAMNELVFRQICAEHSAVHCL
jgi:DNA-binding NarL/FixJ family response regulator